MNNVTAIIKTMNIKQRTDGRYEGRVTNNGIRKSFYGKTKAEVKNKAKEYLTKIENGYREPKRILLNDYIEYWLKAYKWNKIEPSSFTRLYRVYDTQIKDSAIGNKQIGLIETKDIQKLIDDHANPPDDTIKPLALSGLKRIKQLLRPCFEKAVEEGIIYRNPCDNIIMPVISCIETETKVQFSLTPEELDLFQKTALSKYKTSKEYKSRDALVLLLMVNLGVRVGEMQALLWKDIDLENRLVHINKTVQNNIKNFNHAHGDNQTYTRIKKSTKTKAGVRVIQLNDTVLGYIKEIKAYDTRNQIQSPFVACTSVGTMNCARNLQRSLDRLVRNAGITRHVTLHTLRHTFGSTLLRKGINIEVVSKLMGHANITITYNKYIHTIQEEEAKAMNMIKVC